MERVQGTGERYTQNNQINELEQRYNINLSQSRAVPDAHVTYVGQLAQKFVNWAADHERDESLKERVNLEHFIVLSPDDHRTVGSAIKKARMAQMERWLRNIPEEMQTSPDVKLVRNAIIEHYKGLQEWNTQPIPPANIIYELSPGNELKKWALFSDWSEANNPHSRLSLEGAVAEETVQMLSRFEEGLTPFTNIVDAAQVSGLEKMALKYYTARAMLEQNIGNLSVMKYNEASAGLGESWGRFRRKSNHALVDKMYFQGKADANLIRQLVDHVNEEKNTNQKK